MLNFIKRKELVADIDSAFKVHPIVAILGPRQCGKTTIAREFSNSKSKEVYHFDLEDPEDLSKLQQPKLALQNLEGLVVIDEIQRLPELFPLLRVLVDRVDNKANFLILGSASRDLIQQSSETLAGRIQYIQMTPLRVSEIPELDFNKHWIRGGFPLSYLSDSDENSFKWRKAYISTFLERDIPNLGISIPPRSLRRFWTMLAHYHGQVINYSQIARSIQTTDTTVRRYLDILEGTFMVRVLSPWHENIKKRQVKSPKIYIRDSGILHSLLAINNHFEILGNPKVGASWEGYCLEEIINKYDNEDCYFWATHGGAELDLLVVKGQKRIGFEIKYASSVKITKSLHIAMEELNLDQMTIVVPGKDSYYLSEEVRVVGLEKLIEEI